MELLIIWEHQSGGFYPGNGSGAQATFTAPVTGTYSFTISANTNSATGIFYIGLNTPSLNYSSYVSSPTSGFATFLVQMTANDIATFPVIQKHSAPALDVSILSAYAGGSLAISTVNSTFISGYRVA